MNLENDIPKIILQLVKDEVKPAIGCTEPVAVAYAVATAHQHFAGLVESIIIKPSLSIYKNGKSVMVPGTTERGLDMAAALGYVMVTSNDPLCIFKGVDAEAINQAKDMLRREIISIIPVHNNKEIFVDVEMIGGGERVHVILADHHAHIESLEVNGKKIYLEDNRTAATHSHDVTKSLTFHQMIEIAENAKASDIEYFLTGVTMNRFAAAQGLKKESGFRLGIGLSHLEDEGNLKQAPSLRARVLTAAGADFRMGGGDQPIMTSGGSGNQGLGVILPIAEVADYIHASDESLARALYLGHMINIYIKEYTGKLSALCGCAIASGIGATASIAWLLGGNEEQIEGAARNMLSGLTGMICDGAKESCSMKLSASAGEAVISAYLAVDGIVVPAESGIVNGSVESTIRNLGILCEKGMADLNDVLVNIISNN